VTALTALADANWLTAARIRRIAVIFVAMAAFFFGADVWLHTRAGVTDASGEQLGRDFVNYWAGAHLAAQGHAARVYDIDAFVAWQRAHTAANANFKWYSYPPTTLLLSLPLALLNFKAALVVWLAVGWLVCVFLLKRVTGWEMAALAAGAPTSFMNALWGQNGQFTAALMCGGVMLLDSNPLMAGGLLGLLCFKPHLAVLIPVALLAGGYWRVFTAAGVTALGVVIASYLSFGGATWIAFIHNAPINTLLLEHEDQIWHRMPTVFAMVRLIGGTVTAAYGLQIISAAAAIVLVARFWRSDAPTIRKGAVMILATFLTTPYAWDYDLVALTFVVAWLAADGLRSGFRPWEKGLLALTMVTPLILSPLGAATHFQIGPLVLWSMLLLTAWSAVARTPEPVIAMPG
jgi:arabinofuranan 3-O-arabinosyltransferase